jgi:hypothetical protein
LVANSTAHSKCGGAFTSLNLKHRQPGSPAAREVDLDGLREYIPFSKVPNLLPSLGISMLSREPGVPGTPCNALGSV